MAIGVHTQTETVLRREGRFVTEALRQMIQEIDTVFNPSGSGDDLLKKYKGKNANFIYCCYAFLFRDYFPSVPLQHIRQIALSGRLILEYLLIHDAFVDNRKDLNDQEILVGGFIQYKALDLLYQIFDPSSSFWGFFTKYYKEYVHAVVLEKKGHVDRIASYHRSEMERIATGKAALGKLVIAALGVLSGSEERIADLERSHDDCSIGLQCWDDLRDWKSDFRAKRYSYLLTNLLLKHGYVDGGQKDLPSTETVGKMLHYSGAVEFTMEEVHRYLTASLSSLGQFGPLLWRDWVRELKKEVEDFLSDYRRVKDGILGEKTLPNKPVRKTSPRMLREKIASSIRRGLGYINSSISEEGFWQDFFLTTGKSTAWVTGYLAQILSFLAKQKMASGETRINLKKTKEWIISAADDLGGWGYNQWSGVDADSSTNCLLFLSECEGVPEEIQRKALEVILKNQNPSDGGFATFSATEIKRQIDKGNPWFPPPPEQYSGWCSSDTYITALSAYTLALVNREFYWDRILRALDFVMGEQSGSGYWNAYWSNGRMLGTFACVRLLRELNVGKRCVESAVRWVRGLQNGPGAWSDGVSGRPTPFDTALALQILMMADRQGGMEMIAMGVRWLVNSQLPDGSWKSFPWLAVPHCAKVKSYRKDDFSYEDKGVNDHRRLFTTATVLSALSHYWVDRNLR